MDEYAVLSLEARVASLLNEARLLRISIAEAHHKFHPPTSRLPPPDRLSSDQPTMARQS